MPTENCVINSPTNRVRNCHFPIELETAKIDRCRMPRLARLDCRNIRFNIERFSILPKLVELKRPQRKGETVNEA